MRPIYLYLLNAFNLRRIHLQSEDYIYGFIYKITTTVHIRKGNHKRYIPKENHIQKKNQQETQARDSSKRPKQETPKLLVQEEHYRKRISKKFNTKIDQERPKYKNPLKSNQNTKKNLLKCDQNCA